MTKEFYETFWEELKKPFMNSLHQARVSQKLVISQRQGAIIKLLEKKEKDKRLISNWRHTSSFNVDYKIISKILASRLKKVLPNVISSQQTEKLRRKNNF